MHRSLVIQLGKAFDDVVSELSDEYGQRVQNGLSRGSVLRFMDAPPEAVGNLTNPIQVLREKLEKELATRARDLLQVGDSLGGEIMWDVFFLINLGEPLVANAASVVFDMLERLISEEYETIFATHKRGSARRLRFIPIAVIPSNTECKRSRADAIDELRQFHDRVVERRQKAREEGGRDFPVDRVFVLDAVTPFGVLKLRDLTDQVSGFVRLLLYSGLRTHAEFSLALEKEQHDLFASFGCATLSLNLREVSDVLTARGAGDVAAFLTNTRDVKLPSLQAILPEAVLTDPERLADALDEIEALPIRVLEADGLASLKSLLDLHGSMLSRLDELRTREEEIVQELADDERRREEKIQRDQRRPWGWMGATSLVMGFAVFAVGFWWIVVPVGIAIAAGLGFALLTALLLFFLTKITSHGDERAKKSPSPARSIAEPEGDASRIDLIAPVVGESKRRIETLMHALKNLEYEASDELAARVEASSDSRRFNQPIATQGLYDFWYEQTVGQSSTLARSFIEASAGDSTSPMRDLLWGETELTAEALIEFVRGDVVNALTTLFDKPESRESVGETLQAFVQEFQSGLPMFLEGISRQQFDPTGFVNPVRNACYVHPVFQNMATRVVDRSGTPFTVHASNKMFDVVLLSVTTDIHLDAVAILSDRNE